MGQAAGVDTQPAPHAYTVDHDVPVPTSLRAAKIVMVVAAALTVITVLAMWSVAGMTPETVGRGIWVCVPAFIALVAARRMRPSQVRWLWWSVGAGALWVLAALASVGRGDPRGLTQLILPVVVLVLVTRPAARRYFRGWS